MTDKIHIRTYLELCKRMKYSDIYKIATDYNMMANPSLISEKYKISSDEVKSIAFVLNMKIQNGGNPLKELYKAYWRNKIKRQQGGNVQQMPEKTDVPLASSLTAQKNILTGINKHLENANNVVNTINTATESAQKTMETVKSTVDSAKKLVNTVKDVGANVSSLFKRKTNTTTGTSSKGRVEDSLREKGVVTPSVSTITGGWNEELSTVTDVMNTTNKRTDVLINNLERLFKNK